MELINSGGTLAEEKIPMIEELMLAWFGLGAVDVGIIVTSDDDDMALIAATSENEILGATDDTEEN